MCILGIDIGGTNIRMGCIDEKNNVSNFIKIYQEKVLNTDNNVEALGNYIKKYIEDNHLDNQIEAIGLALPAPISKDERICLQAPNIKGFDNVDVATPIETITNIKTYVLKDVWPQVMYDVDKLQLQQEEVIMAAYIGTGVGNAIMINGKVFKGANGASGELGHIPVKGNTRLCGCGNIGCAEPIAGGRYLAEIAKERGQDISNILVTSKDIVKEYIDNIALTISAELNILDPSALILGGGVLQMNGFDTSYLEERIHFHARKPFPDSTLKIHYAQDDIYKGVVGAAMYIRNKK